MTNETINTTSATINPTMYMNLFESAGKEIGRFSSLSPGSGSVVGYISVKSRFIF